MPHAEKRGAFNFFYGNNYVNSVTLYSIND